MSQPHRNPPADSGSTRRRYRELVCLAIHRQMWPSSAALWSAAASTGERRRSPPGNTAASPWASRPFPGRTDDNPRAAP